MALNRSDWIIAAVNLMAEKDVAAVKVEPLARLLGVSKGSFYWHFANRKELLSSILETWEQETSWLIEESRKAEDPLEQLQTLFSLIGSTADKHGGYSIDTAIFRWSHHDKDVAQRVQHVESQRITFLQEVLQAMGLPVETSSERTELMYLAFLGYVDRANRMPAYRSEEAFDRFGKSLIQLLLQP